MKLGSWMLLCVALIAFSHPVKGISPLGSDTLSIWVNGLCGMCKDRIETAALKVRGVESASWSTETRMLDLTLNPDKFKERKLHYSIASAGHDTRELLAPDPVYDALHSCCKYRDFKTHNEAIGAPGEGVTVDEVTGDEETGNRVSGLVTEIGEDGSKTPLVGANIYWMNTTSGTSTDEKGQFSLEREEGAHMLIVSYVGYGSDTLHVDGPSEVVFIQ